MRFDVALVDHRRLKLALDDDVGLREAGLGVAEARLQPARDVESATTQEMRIEVRESDNGYQIFAELTGVRKDDISVQIDGNRVSISAEVKREAAAETAERVLRNERFYGTLARSFALAHELDEAGAQARFDNGVLILTLPKAQAPTAHKLVIN